MILFFSEEHKLHLQLLHTLAVPVLVDFCKLTLDFLQNGPNTNKYGIASQKLQVDQEVIQNVVHALLFILVEGCKYNLSEKDFLMSLSIAGFSAEHQEILLKCYNTRKSDLTDALHKLQDTRTTYQDVAWRFQVQTSSRFNEEVKPKVTMDLILKTPKPINECHELDSTDAIDSGFSTPQSNLASSEGGLIVLRNISEARTASECENVITHVLLDCDLPNLVSMTSKLEQALLESKSQHVRKLHRALQRK